MRESKKRTRTKILTAWRIFLLSLLVSFVLYGCLTVSSVKPDSASQDQDTQYWPQEEGYNQRWQPLKK